MLGGRISNQEEEEVEDELAALEAELSAPRPVSLPAAPDTALPSTEETQPELSQTRQQERQPMLA